MPAARRRASAASPRRRARAQALPQRREKERERPLVRKVQPSADDMLEDAGKEAEELRRLARMEPLRVAGAECEQRWRRYRGDGRRSEEHTSELQSLMRTSYAVF